MKSDVDPKSSYNDGSSITFIIVTLVVLVMVSASMFLVVSNMSGHGWHNKAGIYAAAINPEETKTSTGHVAYTLDLPNGTLMKGNYLNPLGSPGVFGVMYDNFSHDIYVSDLHSNSMFVVNSTSDTVDGSISAGYNLIRMAYDASNHYVYGALAQSGQVAILGVGGSVLGKLNTGKTPSGVAYDPSNGNIYVANQGANDVSVISSSSNKVIDTVPVGSGPITLAYDSVNKNMYVGNSYSSNVSVINSTTNNVTSTINVGTFPDGISVDPQSNMVYVANRNASTVTIVNGSTEKPVTTIPVGKYPSAVAFDSQNSYIYVTDFGSNSTTVINTTTNIDIANLKVGVGPQGIVYDPQNNNIYVSNFASTTVSIIGNSFGIYSIIFNETGVALGNQWTVNLSDGQSITSSNSHMTFQLTNGTFSYTATASNGSMVAKPSSSSFTVSGAGSTISLKFVKTSFITPVEIMALISAIVVLVTAWGIFFAVMRIRKQKRN